ncbi:hypothetical protein LJR074_003694 [Acidovorax sp. LjRoot74]|uniref:hypothetical protein n=1 Tax=Acidovorax sp. LjRoot74 TaxID=3342337 RepID=UPI003ECF45F7
MSVTVGTDTKLLHMLGITQKNVLKADIRLRHDEIATVTLTCAADLDDTQLTTAQFTLWALDPQPKPATPPSLDLDAMCAAAQERLAKATHLSAEWAKQYQQEESDAIHVRMNRALRHYKAAATLALSQLHPKGERLTALEAVRADAIELLFEAKTNVEKVDDIIRSDFLRMNATKSPAARAFQ